MTTPHHRTRPRHLVLIDFDWQDADLLPALQRTPDATIRLVVGRQAGDPGVRTAALCGLRRTHELAELTREIFDVALLGSRSPRREPLERLLRVLGTHVESPQGFALPPAGPPGVAATPVALLSPGAFSMRLGESIERRVAEGLEFELYRAGFEGTDEAVQELLRRLPERLREVDAACMPAPNELLLLWIGPPETCARERAGLERLWIECGPARGAVTAPPLTLERIELALAAAGGDARA
jgi:hypothetical protein